MHDLIAAHLHDAELMDEIELVSGIIVAASAAPAPLDQATVDRLLGLDGTTDPAFPAQRSD